MPAASSNRSNWTGVQLSGLTPKGKTYLGDYINTLADLKDRYEHEELFGEIEIVRRLVLRRNPLRQLDGTQMLNALIAIISDLTKLGWTFRFNSQLEYTRPEEISTRTDSQDSLERRTSAVAKFTQLLRPSIHERICRLEKGKYLSDRMVSIFSLVRDGRELENSLRKLEHEFDEIHDLDQVINPYIQFVRPKLRCKFTGIELKDIWWYFRQTWAIPYESTPGRSLQILIRDAATKDNCVIGIAALSSGIIQHKVRDEYIGWDTNSLLQNLVHKPTASWCNWLYDTVDEEVDTIYKDDLLAEDLLFPSDLYVPTETTVTRLEEFSKNERARYRDNYRENNTASQEDSPSHTNDEYWRIAAESPLFRSKRAAELARLLKIKRFLSDFKSINNRKKALEKILKTSSGRVTVRNIIRYAKHRTVGTALAELTTCGAIEPYATILGGKLISLLMISPEVVREYKHRYQDQINVIASSMAGHIVQKENDLAFIATTSLYGRPNQYTRLQIPSSVLGKQSEQKLRFEYLGKTKGQGTLHISKETIRIFHKYMIEIGKGRKVKYAFGEGGNAKLRIARDALEHLGFDSDDLLKHGSQRRYYGVKLIKNTKRYLLGIDASPKYLLPRSNTKKSTEMIAQWWAKRWLSKRLQRADKDNLYERLSSHTLIRPIRHGARVKLPKSELEQADLFPEQG